MLAVNDNAGRSAKRHLAIMSLDNISLLSCLLLASLTLNLLCASAEAEERLNIEGRQQRESNEDLAATINYLESVDKYFSQLARPR